MQIGLTVATSTAVAPGLTSGSTGVRLADLSTPGVPKTEVSSGWKLSTNWSGGYEMKVASSTDPAMKATDAVNSEGEVQNFSDFTTGGCPCDWSTSGFTSGVYGYSADVRTTSGATADGSKWGSSSNRKWRGFTRDSYTVFTTPGGTGAYEMDLYLRTEIPETAAQPAGSYRSTTVISVVPNLL